MKNCDDIYEPEEIKNCQICLKVLDTDNPLREDCGGDCLECMADIGEDPDCVEKVKKIREGI